ncbi:hypothetical protein [Kutzneria chonburiensis]|uniref:Uncharacterized protein n=1 Tax=Kutzneria chonburiensis TaxID=1483604 RepID=A0ABV6N4G2_9PSEU|nr:hypothetical protein [Kutzneria chonburiensis]
MQFRGIQSWQVSWGTGYVVQLALYLRDALAVPAAPEVPPLTPPVPTTDELDRAAVAAEWPGWWADVLAFVGDRSDNQRDQHLRLPIWPGSPALVDRPAIQAALDVLGPRANHHPQPPRPSNQRIGDIVRAREAELGRPARPFRLVVTELPVEGLLWYRITEQHVLVSSSFAEDDERCSAALKEIVAELA